MPTISIPNKALVLMVGPSGSGKSTLSRRIFLDSEVVSSDAMRKMVSDDETNQSVSGDAFEILHLLVEKRLALGKLTVVDATNVRRSDRAALVGLAKKYHLPAVALVFKTTEDECRARSPYGSSVVHRQFSNLRKDIGGIHREGFREVINVTGDEEVMRYFLETDRSTLTGAFDIIGDTHGCADEMLALVEKLGYPRTDRTLVFVGDLTDRGPKVCEVLDYVMDTPNVLCVLGNHEHKLNRALRGNKVTISDELQGSIDQITTRGDAYRVKVMTFIDSLPSHLVLDEGRLVVVHAAIRENMIGRSSRDITDFAIYGDVDGTKDEDGFPVRRDWARNYAGKALICYGHTPVAEPTWNRNTINIDTGCCFGGKLTALRFPEKETISIPAARVYMQPHKPLLLAEKTPSSVLDINTVMNKAVVETRLAGPIQIHSDRAAMALETMSRFAVDPRWLIYLPPTMSPGESSAVEGYLEHPQEAFQHYADAGVTHVVCEEKHMGSRAIVIVGRDSEVISKRFHIESEAAGIIYTRNGRRFFYDNPQAEFTMLNTIRTTLTRAHLWTNLDTDWLCIDAEIMPWSAKAVGLIRKQYAAHAASGLMVYEAIRKLLPEDADYQIRARDLARFRETYRAYCQGEVRIAPFHFLAGASGVYNFPHNTNMQYASGLALDDKSGTIIQTKRILCALAPDLLPQALDFAVEWWTNLTDIHNHGEGMVVKPYDFIPVGDAQPALKVRGQEYLRLVYGPDYLQGEHLNAVRKRSTFRKRELASKEFALGIEGLERFVRGESLGNVHQCSFAVMALESESTDPRL